MPLKPYVGWYAANAMTAKLSDAARQRTLSVAGWEASLSVRLNLWSVRVTPERDTLGQRPALKPL